jgi:hypothetical protein
MIETIFIGIQLLQLSDDSTLFALAIILQHQRKVNITTTPTAMVGAYGFKIANELTKLHIGCNLISAIYPLISLST